MSSVTLLRTALLAALIATTGACATTTTGDDVPAETAGESDANVYVEPQTGIGFPETLGRMIRVGVHEYGGALGRSVRYEDRAIGIRADIFVYDAGRGPVPTGTASDVVQQELQNAVDDVRVYVRKGGYDSASLKRTGEVDLGDAELSLLHAEFEIVVKNVTVRSHIYIRGQAGQFLKLRVTYPLETASFAQEELSDLLGALPELLRPRR